MTKKLLILSPLLLIGILLIYFNLPFEITRKSDIDFGNALVHQIEQYQATHHTLPQTGDWQTLEQLGFKMELLGTNPTYDKISDQEFELTYLEGFDGPYLLYNSKLKDWKVDFPTIPDKGKE